MTRCYALIRYSHEIIQMSAFACGMYSLSFSRIRLNSKASAGAGILQIPQTPYMSSEFDGFRVII